MITVPVVIRLDTEDFISPESNDALLRICESLSRRGIRATFPLVGRKLRFLFNERRRDLLTALSKHEVGYHSDTHSLHPTIAEELAPLDWKAGVRAFLDREREGLEAVNRCLGPVRVYTQPGGNWVPQAFPALASLGVTVHYSEAWNAYLTETDRPHRFAGMIHLSPPVHLPKPFFSRLPGAEAETLNNLRRAYEAIQATGRGSLHLVAHPTELTASRFWDEVNFSHGRNPGPHAWVRPPIRPHAEVRAALAAWERLLDEMRSWPGVLFLSVGQWLEMCGAAGEARRHDDVLRRLEPPVLAEALTVGDPVLPGGIRITPAEALWLLADRLSRGDETGGSGRRGAFRALPDPLFGPCDACEPDPLPPGPGGRRLPVPVWLQLAERLADAAAQEGYLPRALPLPGGSGDVLLEELAGALVVLAGLTPSERPEALAAPVADWPAAGRVKPEAELHWDWPVFPEGFAPRRLRQWTLMQSWTIRSCADALL